MRRSLRRWLFQRRQPQIAPLILRTSWFDFAGRMHRAIDLDIRFDLGEITRSEMRDRQKTRPIPRVDCNAPTVAEQAEAGFHADETIVENRVDQYATQPMVEVG